MTSSTLGTPRHVDPGTYEVRAPDGLTQGPIVGYVHVEGQGGQRVEHWVLFPVLARWIEFRATRTNRQQLVAS